MSEQSAKDTTTITDDTLMGMSDEELSNLDSSFLGEEEFGHELDDAHSEEEDSQEFEEDPSVDEPEGSEDDSEDDAGASDEDEEEDFDNSEEPHENSGSEQGEDEDASEGDEDEEPSEEDAQTEIDYEAEYKKLFEPFRANGKDLKVESIDEIKQLMQMGANYNKKMAALKPNLKLLKLLERNELMDDGKLSYLIDLNNKDPEAIKKLVVDSGIDPMDIDTESESNYTPQTYTVDDREIELDSVLDRIQDTPTYSKTINLFSNKWDAPSKRAAADHPELLEVINNHMSSGIYDRIASEVDRQRTFGRLSGLSDIEAYRTVGDELDAQGAFNDLGAQPEQQAPQQKTVVKAPKKQDPKLAKKRRAASSTRKAPTRTDNSENDFNPLSLSDEEFEKMVNEKLM